MSENTTSDHWRAPWTVTQRGWGAGDGHRITEIVTVDPETGSRWTVAQVGYPDDPEALGIAHLMASSAELRVALRSLMNYVLDIVPDEVLDVDDRLQMILAGANTALGAAGTVGQGYIPSTWRPLPPAPLPAGATL